MISAMTVIFALIFPYRVPEMWLRSKIVPDTAVTDIPTRNHPRNLVGELILL